MLIPVFSFAITDPREPLVNFKQIVLEILGYFMMTTEPRSINFPGRLNDMSSKQTE